MGAWGKMQKRHEIKMKKKARGGINFKNDRWMLNSLQLAEDLILRIEANFKPALFTNH